MTFKLFDRLPEGVTVGGRFYKCDFDFRNVLKMLDVMQRQDLEFSARDYHCVKCVFSGHLAASRVREVYSAICNLLFEKTPENGEKKLMSFEQDAPLIRAAFRQTYGIDLFRDKLTWFEFTELLHGLPDGNRFTDVVGIRARPLPAPTKWNAKEREALLKSKQAVALHMDEHERGQKYEKDVSRIFGGLLAWAEAQNKGSET